jgi:hypothetical protein
VILAVPLGIVGARALSNLIAGMFNFDLTGFHLVPQAIALQIAIGLIRCGTMERAATGLEQAGSTGC